MTGRTDSGAHADEVRASFTGQASAFESDRFIGSLVTDADWVLQRLAVDGSELALDVAAGTGHAARGLAPRVRSVVAVDATPAMLETGHEAARAAGLGNVVFLQGDALALPFVEGTFDVAICRFAAHHIHDLDGLLAEMVRCVRPGGQLMLADLVADADPDVAAAQDRLELLRDPSHARCPSVDELERRFGAHGLTDLHVDLRETVRPLTPWLEQTGTAADHAALIREALETELNGGPPTGLAPERRDDDLWFRQRFAAVTGRLPG